MSSVNQRLNCSPANGTTRCSDQRNRNYDRDSFLQSREASLSSFLRSFVSFYKRNRLRDSIDGPRFLREAPCQSMQVIQMTEHKKRKFARILAKSREVSRFDSFFQIVYIYTVINISIVSTIFTEEANLTSRHDK